MRENQKCCYNSGIGVYIRNVLNAVRLLCNEDYRDPFITLGSCKCENESNPFIEIEAMHRGRTGSSNKGCAGAQIVGAQGSHRGSNSGHAGAAQGLRRGSNSGRKWACAGIQTGLKRGMRKGSNGTRRGHVGLKQGPRRASSRDRIRADEQERKPLTSNHSSCLLHIATYHTL